MNIIKSFIYLDEYKMYSISSQIFEGITESILRTESNSSEQDTSQKGPMASGRVMADIISSSHKNTEKRYLHDYAYNIFESKIYENQEVLEVTESNIHNFEQHIHSTKFIKITGRSVLNDTKAVHELIHYFKLLHYGLDYISKGGANIKAEKRQATNNIKSVNDRNKKSLLEDMINKKASQLLSTLGSSLDDEYMHHLEFIIKEMYKDQLLFQIVLSDLQSQKLFSASLNRNYLKEDINTLIHKYSRETEKSLTLFGIVTQSGNTSDKVLQFIDDKINDPEEKTGMREAMMNMISHMTGIDATLTGRLDYEFVIDPIAIYYQL